MAMKQPIALAIAATVVAVALAAASGTAGASTTTWSETAPTTTARAWQSPAPAVRTTTLTVGDNGRRIRVRRGEDVLVRLRVDPRTSPDPRMWWRAIGEFGRPLTARPQTAVSVRGMTRGRYRAVARGEARLSSSRSVCRRHGNGPTCHSMQRWAVTVDVR
jgi:hypothetical protein